MMNKAGLYLVRCKWCKKDHAYLGEDFIVCCCGAITRIIEIDDGQGHTKCLTYSPEKSQEMTREIYENRHAPDDAPWD